MSVRFENELVKKKKKNIKNNTRARGGEGCADVSKWIRKDNRTHTL